MSTVRLSCARRWKGRPPKWSRVRASVRLRPVSVLEKARPPLPDGRARRKSGFAAASSPSSCALSESALRPTSRRKRHTVPRRLSRLETERHREPRAQANPNGGNRRSKVFSQMASVLAIGLRRTHILPPPDERRSRGLQQEPSGASTSPTPSASAPLLPSLTITITPDRTPASETSRQPPACRQRCWELHIARPRPHGPTGPALRPLNRQNERRHWHTLQLGKESLDT